MAILLDRMAIFSPFVKKHFTISPKIISAIFFLTCFLIDVPFAFSLKVAPIGTFSFLIGENLQSNVTFYVGVSSDFASSPFGRILVSTTSVFLNLTLTLNVGLALNIISVRQYQVYIRNRSPLQLQEATSQLTAKQRSEQKAERNLFVMALTLSSISIGSRIIFACCYFYYFFFSTEFAVTLILYTGYTLGPTASILVFYSYNKIFRQEVKATILRRRTTTSITYTS